MADEGFKRKLAAILSADVEGYSRLMVDDESATVKTLTSYQETITLLICNHRGRLVDSPGDNLLAEFASVVDAVQCAVEMQELLKAKNADLSENRRMQFRIGINLGDVIEEGNRIYGDGVNIASRIEAMADPGGICISRSVYNEIKKKLVLDYEDLGEHAVKNISEPIRVYRVPLESEAGTVKVGAVIKTKVSRWQWAALAVAMVIIIVAGALVIQEYISRPEPFEAASVEKMAFPLPDKPSLAVLPFDNMSKDPDMEYLCDGITETFIAIFSKIPEVFVIARNSSFTYRGKSVDVKKVAEELGVQYVIEGSVQKSGDHIRIAIQVVDALTGHHIFSEVFDRNLNDIFKLQDEIIFEILKSIQIRESKVEKVKSYFVIGTDNLDAHLKILEANYNFNFGTKERVLKAVPLIEEAIAIDPDFAEAYYHLSMAYLEIGRYYSSGESRRINFEKALKFTEKALELDNTLSWAHASLGDYYLYQEKYDMAVTEYKNALEFSSENPWHHSGMAMVFTFINRLEEAVYHAKEAMRLDPLSPVHVIRLGRAYYHLRQYEDAIRMHKKIFELMEKVPYNPRWPHLHLAMVYSELGRDEEAHAHMKKVLENYPRFNLEERRGALHFKDPADSKREIEALRKAGAPENPPSK